MERIAFEYFPHDQNPYDLLMLTNGSEEVAFLEYQWDQDAEIYHLEQLTVSSEYRRKGYGTKVLAEFTKRVGAGKNVDLIVMHQPSLDHISAQFQNLSGTKGVYMASEEEITAVPLTKLLQKAGIHINRMDIEYAPYSDPESDEGFMWNVSVSGTTEDPSD